MSDISIIIPIYKVEQYLQRCIDSILKQSFVGFEIILIDDGSPDNCGKICDDYKEIDDRIVVIHQENRGLSGARNAGIEWVLKNSQCDWITFIDGDDWVHEDYLKCLLSAALTHDCKVSACDYKKAKGDEVDLFELADSVKLTASELYNSHYYVAQSAWCKLYHKSLFVGGAFRFPEGILHEDSAIVYQFLFNQNSIAFSPNGLYYYYQREESITGTGWNPKRMIYCEVQSNQLQWLEDHGYSECVRECVLHYLQSLHYNEHQIHKKIEYSDYAGEMRKISRTLIKKYGRKYGISVKNYPCLFETGYPRIMALYWFFVAQVQKIRGGQS